MLSDGQNLRLPNSKKMIGAAPSTRPIIPPTSLIAIALIMNTREKNDTPKTIL